MNATIERGMMLAERLGIKIIGTEGHDLKCACVACDSSDAGRIHSETGVYFCYSCQKPLSAYDLCKVILHDNGHAKKLMMEVGLFNERNGDSNGHATSAEQVFFSVCRTKRVPPDAWKSYGAEQHRGGVKVPMYGLDGKPCSSIHITPANGKGIYEKGKPTGLFLPKRLPAPGETWLIVEGAKDAPALSALGHFAAGLASNRLSEKFSELFRGVDVVILTDGDKPGRDGGQTTTDLLFGIAASVRVASFPDGMDARDVIAKDGPEGIERVIRGAKHKGNSLPPIVDFHDLRQHDMPLPPELIQGVLHCGSKMSFGGASKSNTTWTLESLALAVAYGKPWLGFETRQSRVLLVDLELQPAFCRKRLLTIQKSLQIDSKSDLLCVWPLRGFAAGHKELFPKIIDRIRGHDFGLVILDPIYKLYGSGTDENSARDVADLLNSVESLAVETGAAVVYRGHFSKGNQSGKNSIDRVSGSGVFARDPDSILNLTAHDEGEGYYAVDATLRNFPPVEPFVVSWNFPLFDRRNDLNPAALKKPGGRPAKYTADDLLEALDDGMTGGDWQGAANIKSNGAYTRFRRELEEAGRVEKRGGKWWKIGNPPKPET